MTQIAGCRSFGEQKELDYHHYKDELAFVTGQVFDLIDNDMISLPCDLQLTGRVAVAIDALDRNNRTALYMDEEWHVALSLLHEKINVVEFKIPEEDVVFISTGAILHTVGGYVYTRNDAELENDYGWQGWDSGSIRYTELEEDIFFFSASL